MLKKVAVVSFIIVLFASVGYCLDVVKTQFVVSHGASSEVSFRVGILEKGELSGTFQSTDSIYVYLFDENGHNLFIQGKQAFTLYNSGKTTRGEIKVNLGKGRYWIVFDAKHALFKDRTVAANIVLK